MTANALFPLTPALSPGEREIRSPAPWKILRGDCAMTLEMPEHSAADSFSPREKARMRGKATTPLLSTSGHHSPQQTKFDRVLRPDYGLVVNRDRPK